MALACCRPAGAAEAPRFDLPLVCEPGISCVVQNYVDHDPSGGARDHACGGMTYDGHNGTDFRLRSLLAMRQGVPVVAAAAGRVARVRDGVADGKFRPGDEAVLGRECGNGVVLHHAGGWETQYCHLARGSISVRPGEQVASGHRLGLVGLSGKTEYPHLHFTVRRDDAVVDPFAYGVPAAACGGGRPIWDAAVAPRLGYRPGLVFGAGFAGGPVTFEEIENEQWVAPAATSQALVAFVRAIGLRAGDTQRLIIRGPGNAVLADSTAQPLPGDKAQSLMYAGKKRSGASFAAGNYRATYSVQRGGSQVIEENFEITLRPVE